ncbi:MAG: 30S ribosomal protein S6 [Thermodesulfobacteriota bacterium]
MSRQYELIFIVKPDAGEEITTATTQKVRGVVEASKGEIITVEEWGKRKLAYPIQKCTEGHYIYLRFTAPPAAINETERLLRLNEQVIRYLTVKVDPSKVAPLQPETGEETSDEPLAEEGGSNE